MARVLLTIATTARDASDIGFLLHKNPASVTERELSFGKARVFYDEATRERASCCLLVEVDNVEMVRGDHGPASVGQYVNDRPYVAGSMTAAALKACFSTAMAGKAKDRPERLFEEWPLEVSIPTLACPRGEAAIREAFEPLGYTVDVSGHLLDDRFPEWGPASVYSVVLTGHQTVRRLLQHLYVLLPALGGAKHYWIGEDEVEKLVRAGEEWLGDHPAKNRIVRDYLGRLKHLAREALSRLAEEAEPGGEAADSEERTLETNVVAADDGPERVPLNQARLNSVLAVLRDPARGVRSVLDVGCGEGALLEALRKEPRFARIVGLDVSPRSLRTCARRLHLDPGVPSEGERVSLMHGSALYVDKRLEGFDAVVLTEVIEHIEPDRLADCAHVVFGAARPRLAVVTTPNVEYNAVWESLASGKLRHRDHRFEWTRAEFAAWCDGVATQYGYAHTIHPIGPLAEAQPDLGPPTQMAVFTREGAER